MNLSSTILFSCVSIVAVFAISMILYSRKRRNPSKQHFYQEPVLSDQQNGLTNDDENDYSNAEEYAVVIERRPTISRLSSHHSIVQSSPVEDEADDEISAVATLFPQNLIMLNLRAPTNSPYGGYELLQALLSAGLRYGRMQIFHRYEQLNGGGKILFSLASIAKPGTFEIPKMGGFVCPGLSLFMRVSSQKDVSSAFETLFDTARQLAEDLGGEILDERRLILTDETLANLRARIQAFEEAKRSADMFA